MPKITEREIAKALNRVQEVGDVLIFCQLELASRDNNTEPDSFYDRIIENFLQQLLNNSLTVDSITPNEEFLINSINSEDFESTYNYFSGTEYSITPTSNATTPSNSCDTPSSTIALQGSIDDHETSL